MCNKHTPHQESLYPILSTFFDQYHVESCEETLWDLLTAYVGQEDADLEGPISRSNTVYFCRNINKLLRELSKVVEQEAEGGDKA